MTRRRLGLSRAARRQIQARVAAFDAADLSNTPANDDELQRFITPFVVPEAQPLSSVVDCMADAGVRLPNHDFPLSLPIRAESPLNGLHFQLEVPSEMATDGGEELSAIAEPPEVIREDDLVQWPLCLRDFIREWSLKENLTQSSLDRLLNGLQHFLPSENIPRCSKTLYGRANCAAAPVRVMEPGEYIHFGVAHVVSAVVRASLSAGNSPGETLSLMINTDGMNPYDITTKVTLWPIQIIVWEIGNRPVIAGLYGGREKPKSSNELMGETVEELRVLLNRGLIIDDRHYKVSVRAWVCDSPALSFLKCIKASNGKQGCPRCTAVGMSFSGRTIFENMHAEPRTNESFRQMTDREHHHGQCGLTVLPIDMVADFVIDPMHVVYLRVTKTMAMRLDKGKLRFLRVLKNTKTGPKVVYVQQTESRKKGNGLSANQVRQLDERMERMTKEWPTEFQRTLNCFSDHSGWKAHQARTFVLYAIPLVLADCGLPKSRYKMALRLHCACRILSCATRCKQPRLLALATNMLRDFVGKAGKEFGRHFSVYTTHCLLHLVDDVKRFGPLDSFSAFPYENNMRHLGKCVRGPKHPIRQVWSRFQEKRQTEVTGVAAWKVPDPRVVLGKTVSPRTTLFSAIREVKSVRWGQHRVALTRGDRHVMLSSGIARVEAILHQHGGNVVLVCRMYGRTRNLYTWPLDSKELGIHLMCKSSELCENLVLVGLTEVIGKVAAFETPKGVIAMQLLHTVEGEDEE